MPKSIQGGSNTFADAKNVRIQYKTIHDKLTINWDTLTQAEKVEALRQGITFNMSASMLYLEQQFGKE